MEILKGREQVRQLELGTIYFDLIRVSGYVCTSFSLYAYYIRMWNAKVCWDPTEVPFSHQPQRVTNPPRIPFHAHFPLDPLGRFHSRWIRVEVVVTHSWIFLYHLSAHGSKDRHCKCTSRLDILLPVGWSVWLRSISSFVSITFIMAHTT